MTGRRSKGRRFGSDLVRKGDLARPPHCSADGERFGRVTFGEGFLAGSSDGPAVSSRVHKRRRNTCFVNGTSLRH